MDNLAEFKKEIIEIGTKLYDKGFTPGTAGNISIRQENNILISSSGSCLGEMEEGDVVVLDFDGNIVNGSKKPSSEKTMHLEIYKARPDITAIIHAHPPKPTAFAVAGIPLDKPILSEPMVTLGEVPVAEYAMPSSDKLASIVAGYFPNHDAVLLANHGVIIGGKKLKDTFYKLETLNLYAEVSLWAKVLGNPKELAFEDIQDLIKLGKEISKG